MESKVGSARPTRRSTRQGSRGVKKSRNSGRDATSNVQLTSKGNGKRSTTKRMSAKKSKASTKGKTVSARNPVVKGPPRRARKRSVKGSWPDLKLGLTNFALVHLSEYSRRLTLKLNEFKNRGALSEQKANMMLALAIHISEHLERYMQNMPREWTRLGRVRVFVAKMQSQLEEILRYDPDHYETYVLQSNVQAMRIWLSRATIGMTLSGYQVALYHCLQLKRHLAPKLTNKKRPQIKALFWETLVQLVNHVKECYSRWKTIEERLESKGENAMSVEELRELLNEWHKASRKLPYYVHVFISKIPDAKRKTFKEDLAVIRQFLVSSERLSSPSFIDEHVLFEAGEHDKHLEQIHSFDRATFVTVATTAAASTSPSLTEPETSLVSFAGRYDLTPTWSQLISSYHPHMLIPKVIGTSNT